MGEIRSMDWLERLDILIGESKVKALEDKTVAIFGLGGVGSYAVEGLVRSGIGNLIIVDYAEVSKSNINRQIIATIDSVGKRKVDVMEERILSINPKCKVIKFDTFIDEDSLNDIFRLNFDAGIDAIDVITSKVNLIKCLKDKDIPFISSLGMGGRLDPTKIEIIKMKDTNYDRLAKSLRKILKDKGVDLDFDVVFSKEETHGKTGNNPNGNTRKDKYPIGSSIFVPATAGLVCASYILKKLTDL